MNRLSLLAAIVVAFVLTGCGSVQDTINSKRNSIFAIMAEKTDEATKEKGSGLGTGFLIGDNQILTNAHVVDGSTKIVVKTENSEVYDAEVVHSDTKIDVAVIKIKDWEKFIAENNITPLSFAASSDINPLDKVYALGNPWGLLFSVSEGVVSHPIRKMDAIAKFLIQTDAHVFQGNSGGPLLNESGEVIGMNSLMLSREGGSYGFALHADIIKKVLADWERDGTTKWATLGVSLSDTNTIMEVMPDSPALKAGLQKDDKIIAIQTSAGKFESNNSMETIYIIALTTSPETVKLTVKRGDKIEVIEVSPNYKPSSEF